VTLALAFFMFRQRPFQRLLLYYCHRNLTASILLVFLRAEANPGRLLPGFTFAFCSLSVVGHGPLPVGPADTARTGAALLPDVAVKSPPLTGTAFSCLPGNWPAPDRLLGAFFTAGDALRPRRNMPAERTGFLCWVALWIATISVIALTPCYGPVAPVRILQNFNFVLQFPFFHHHLRFVRVAICLSDRLCFLHRTSACTGLLPVPDFCSGLFRSARGKILLQFLFSGEVAACASSCTNLLQRSARTISHKNKNFQQGIFQRHRARNGHCAEVR